MPFNNGLIERQFLKQELSIKPILYFTLLKSPVGKHALVPPSLDGLIGIDRIPASSKKYLTLSIVCVC